ncbi:MAG TPA: hypothetical protein VNK26_00550, partial [Pyrinomonadaceae bacterium]|nr:hypothetical protein [Pyrinomonadaceae bacterium]
MKLRALILGFATVAAMCAFSFAAFMSRGESLAKSDLASKLPASDIVVSVNVRRLTDEVLPMLGSSQTGKNLNEMFSEIFKATGLDLQKVDYCEIGLKTIIVKPGEYDFDPVVLVRSQQSLSGLISSVKQNKGMKYREETFGGKVITVLENPAKAGNNGGNNAGNQKTAGSGLKEIALLEIDSNTLALGSIARIKETAEGSSQVNSELISLLNPSAVVSFAGNSPSGMSKMIPLDNDDLGKAIDSIRLLSGYGDTKNGDLSLNITARTVDAKSAQS